MFGNFKLQRPELALAGQVSDGLPFDAFRHQVDKLFKLSIVNPGFGPGMQVAAGFSENVHQQDFGIQLRCITGMQFPARPP